VIARTLDRRKQPLSRIWNLLAAGYALIALTAFLIGYLVLGIRELGLYIWMLVANLPLSLITLPLSERMAGSLGWALGGAAHVWITEMFTLTANSSLILVIGYAVVRLRARYRHRNPRAV